jgi:hypothetical protein
MRQRGYLVIVALICLFTGCMPKVKSTTSPTDGNVATTVTVESNTRSTYLLGEFYCAEPPPDTAIASTVNFSGNVNVTDLLRPEIASAASNIPTTAAINVTGAPQGVNIVLTGPGNFKSEFATAKAFGSAAPGSYTISASAEGYQPATDTFPVSAGESVTVSVKLALMPEANAPESPPAEEAPNETTEEGGQTEDEENATDASTANAAAPADTSPPTENPITYFRSSPQLGSSSDSNLSLQLQTVNEIVELANRTELIEIQRQALYRICEARMNKFITDEQAYALQNEVLYTVRVMSFANLINAANKNTNLNPDITRALIDETLNRGRVFITLRNAKGNFDLFTVEPDGTMRAAYLDAKHYGIIGGLDLSPVPDETALGQQETPDQSSSTSSAPGLAASVGETSATLTPTPTPELNPVVTRDTLCFFSSELTNALFKDILDFYARSQNDLRLRDALATNNPEAVAQVLAEVCSTPR